jgi:hypothetical protein
MDWNTMNRTLSNLKNENKEMKGELDYFEKSNAEMKNKFSKLLDRF